MKKLLVFLLSVIVLVGGYLAYDSYRKVFHPCADFSGHARFEITPGQSVSEIARHLADRRIITSYSHFMIYYRLFFSDRSFKIGEYEFSKALTMRQVIEKLHRGQVILYRFTVKEGLTISETADQFRVQLNKSRKNFIKAAQTPDFIAEVDEKATDLEGYLYPDTYLVPRSATGREMVKMMCRRFSEKFTRTLEWRAHEIKMTVRQVITLASLIEKETADRSERFLISSVFHNRLRIGMALGCDPTIIYALKRDGKWRGKLGWKELKYDSPYNTRLHRGLPPGPICSPGISSIEAALYPENTKYLYFVAKDSRTHYFSKTLKEHSWAVRKYIINRK